MFSKVTLVLILGALGTVCPKSIGLEQGNERTGKSLFRIDGDHNLIFNNPFAYRGDVAAEEDCDDSEEEYQQRYQLNNIVNVPTNPQYGHQLSVYTQNEGYPVNNVPESLSSIADVKIDTPVLYQQQAEDCDDGTNGAGLNVQYNTQPILPVYEVPAEDCEEERAPAAPPVETVHYEPAPQVEDCEDERQVAPIVPAPALYAPLPAKQYETVAVNFQPAPAPIVAKEEHHVFPVAPIALPPVPVVTPEPSRHFETLAVNFQPAPSPPAPIVTKEEDCEEHYEVPVAPVVLPTLPVVTPEPARHFETVAVNFQPAPLTPVHNNIPIAPVQVYEPAKHYETLAVNYQPAPSPPTPIITKEEDCEEHYEVPVAPVVLPTLPVVTPEPARHFETLAVNFQPAPSPAPIITKEEDCEELHTIPAAPVALPTLPVVTPAPAKRIETVSVNYQTASPQPIIVLGKADEDCDDEQKNDHGSRLTHRVKVSNSIVSANAPISYEFPRKRIVTPTSGNGAITYQTNVNVASTHKLAATGAATYRTKSGGGSLVHKLLHGFEGNNETKVSVSQTNLNSKISTSTSLEHRVRQNGGIKPSIVTKHLKKDKLCEKCL